MSITTTEMYNAIRQTNEVIADEFDKLPSHLQQALCKNYDLYIHADDDADLDDYVWHYVWDLCANKRIVANRSTYWTLRDLAEECFRTN